MLLLLFAKVEGIIITHIKVHELTERLFTYNREFLKLYQEARDSREKKDFNLVIKPFVNEVKLVNDEWKASMKNWLSDYSPKHIHLKQIDSISEQIEQISVQAFFPETSKTRFLNVQKTIEFFLGEVLKELEKERRDA